MKTRSLSFALFLTCITFSHECSAQLLDDGIDPSLASIWGDKFDPWIDPTRNDFAPTTSGDSDLGEQLVLMPTQAHLPFSFELTERVRWTSNAGLTDLGILTDLEDVYSATDFRFSYLPQIADDSYFELSAGYALYRYLDYSSLNFDRLEGSLGLIHCFRDFNNLLGWTRYKHYRLSASLGESDLFTDNTIELGLYYPIPLSARQLAFGSYSSKFSLDSNPSSARRHEHTLAAGYTYSPTDRFEVAAYCGVHVFDYTQGGRSDVLCDTGLALTSHLTDRIDVVISANYSWNDSDTAGFDYEVADIGANFGFTLKF